MGYVVHHLSADGAAVLEDLATLQDALARVEVLQNDGQASEVRVLKEVPIQVQTYYRVVAVEESPEPVAEIAPAPADAEEPEAVAEVAPEPASQPANDEVAATDPPEVEARWHDEEPPPSPEPEARREAPVRLQPPPGAMLISPAPAAATRAETRETRETREPAHRGLFSRG